MRLPPHNSEAELAVIGCCLDGGLEITLQAVESIQPGAFYDLDNRKAFSVLEAMATANTPIDAVTFIDGWRKASNDPTAVPPPAILQSPSLIAHSLNIGRYSESVVECYRRRQIIIAAGKLVERAFEPHTPLSSIIAEFEALAREQESDDVPAHNAKECVGLLTDDLERRMNLTGRSGLVTGFIDLDEITDGLQFGEQAIIAARPGVGKTALALNIFARVCLLDKIPALFISMEMDTQALMRRLLSAFEQVPLKTVKNGKLQQAGMAKYAHFSATFAASPAFIVQGIRGLDIDRIAGIVRRHVRKHSVRLVILDYLQKIKPVHRHEKRTYEIGEVSGVLKALAVETNAAFVTAAQLNRESEKEKGRVPRLSDLADSGQIERDADLVCLLDRGKGQAEANLIVAKQRDGETGVVHLVFDGAYCQFKNGTKEMPNE